MSNTLAFRKLGKGPAFVILHGLYGSSDNWITIGRKLEEQFTVFLIDLRNHGSSPHFPSHSYAEMTEDLAQFFFEHKIEKATLLGHSMGGKVAMHFAAEYPEHINRLIVADIAPKDYTVLSASESQYTQHQTILKLLDEIKPEQFKNRKAISEVLKAQIPTNSLRQFLLKNIRRKSTGTLTWKLNISTLRQALPEIISDVNAKWFDERKPITHYPVTFIRGMKSRYILDTDIQPIHTIYPEARIIDIEEAGHWLHAEQPEQFLNALQSSVQTR